MEKIPKSGYCYSNLLARVVLQSFEDIIGENGLNAVLHYIGLDKWIKNLPPENSEREFDFADYSMIVASLEDMYGERGSRVLAYRAGREIFMHGLQEFGPNAGVFDPLFQLLPIPEKVYRGINMIGALITASSDQLVDVEDEEGHYRFIVNRCPICWGRKTKKPCCDIMAGSIEEGLKWFSGGKKYTITQVSAISCGDKVCEYHVLKEPAG